MAFRGLFLGALLCAALGISWGAELRATQIAATPTPSPAEFKTPRALAIDTEKGRCLVLDSGLDRVSALSLSGEPLDSWSLQSLGAPTDLALPTDPLIPNPALSFAGKTSYVLTCDRAAGSITISPISDQARPRRVDLPIGAKQCAFTMDPSGQLLIAYLDEQADGLSLILEREDDEGIMRPVAVKQNPCDIQKKDLSITGFIISRSGKVAVGIAQAGADAYTFQRSWLLQGELAGGRVTDPLHVTVANSLIDSRGVIREAYQPAIALAGKLGYPKKPCVPLFTSLAFGELGTVWSGGHTYDPFLRCYAADGQLLFSAKRRVLGGQQLASTEDGGRRYFRLSGAFPCVEEFSADGRILAAFGTSLPYILSNPISITANEKGVYIALRWDNSLHLVCLAQDGAFRWQIPIAPPAEMITALPMLLAPSANRVLIGWRLPEAIGIGFVSSVMADGSPGMPLWPKPYVGISDSTPKPTAPMLLGGNGKMYLLRELPEGPRVQVYSTSGAFLKMLPPKVPGVSAVNANGLLALLHSDDDGLVLTRYTEQGAEDGMKRVTSSKPDSVMVFARAQGLWCWLSTTKTLCRLDENFANGDEFELIDPEGRPLNRTPLITGDGKKRIYIAQPDYILSVDLP